MAHGLGRRSAGRGLAGAECRRHHSRGDRSRGAVRGQCPRRWPGAALAGDGRSARPDPSPRQRHRAQPGLRRRRHAAGCRRLVPDDRVGPRPAHRSPANAGVALRDDRRALPARRPGPRHLHRRHRSRAPLGSRGGYAVGSLDGRRNVDRRAGRWGGAVARDRGRQDPSGVAARTAGRGIRGRCRCGGLQPRDEPRWPLDRDRR